MFFIFSILFIYSVFGELIWSLTIKCYLCSIARTISLELQTLISHYLFKVYNQMSDMNFKSDMSNPSYIFPPRYHLQNLFLCTSLHPSKPEFHSSSCLGQKFGGISSMSLFISHPTSNTILLILALSFLRIWPFLTSSIFHPRIIISYLDVFSYLGDFLCSIFISL